MTRAQRILERAELDLQGLAKRAQRLNTESTIIRELLKLVEKQQEVILSVQQTSAEGSEKHEWCKEALALTDETLERLGGEE